MKLNHGVFRIIFGGIFLFSIIGCGTPWAIRKDWKTRSVAAIEGMESAVKTPLYATVENFDCKIDGTRLKKVLLKKPGNTYHGARETTAWYCPKDNLYWVFYQEGTGGALKINWFGPFDIPVKVRGKKSEDRSQRSEKT